MREVGAEDPARRRRQPAVNARRQQQQLTYPEVGATAGVMPTGYETIDVTQRIGRGQEWFEIAAQRFAYGTLPGHPESGEERFLVHLNDDHIVTAQIRAFSRPGRWFTRLGRPIARRVQDATTQRYLDALTQRPDAAG